MQPSAFDIFLDLTQDLAVDLPAYVQRVALEEGLFEGRQVTIVLPTGGDAALIETLRPAQVFTDALAGLGFALAGAAERGRALALIIGAWRWRNQTLQALSAEADRDPMVATVQPRFSDVEARHIFGLPGVSEWKLGAAAAALLPAHYVAPELLSPLQVMTPQAVAAVPPLAATSLSEAYAAMLRGLRRRGYRSLICNRTIVPWPGGTTAYRVLPAGVPPGDAEHSAEMMRDMPEHRLERILTDAFDDDGRPRILLDCKGLHPVMNGTAVCIVGLLRGFHDLADPRVRISVLVAEEAARFHRLKVLFPSFDFQHGGPQGGFMAAILLDQPWAISTIRDLHHVAGLIMFNMLDTIAWDIIYAAVPGLGRAWTVLGQVADTLFFISAYSRDRYVFRFYPDERLPLLVTHLSMDPAEIVGDPEAGRVADAPYVLVMGNSYDHKDVAATLSSLSTAFPYTSFISIGAKDVPSANVIAMESGALSPARIARLFADAAVVVFPSHYEGFGLPVGEAIAYGKTIIVRESALWDEIGALSSHPERIVTFRLENDLVAAVGAALHATPVAIATPILSEGAPEPRWADCARVMLDATHAAIAGFDGRRWLIREAMLASA
ncbi:glycosyltransferase [Ancylobacter sp.]|uniref:glycosyltransferase n=1 Tax=Ancylobacter sp. TaxID=1872567 RepID=UPI003C7C3CDD